EAGCDIRLSGELLTMHDQTGRLLVTSKRSRNRLYTVRMGINGGVCLYSKTESETSRWHERLGHINTETIRNMMMKELVEGIPKVLVEKKVRGSCLLGKQARQVFPSSTSYRATKPLELL